MMNLFHHLFFKIDDVDLKRSEVVKNIAIGQANLIPLFFSEEHENIFKQIIYSENNCQTSSLKPCQNNIYMQWDARSMMKTIGIEKFDNDDQFYLAVLESMHFSWAEKIIKLNPTEDFVIRDNEVHSILKSISMLYQNQSGMFTALGNVVNKILDSVSPSVLFKWFNTDVFLFKSTISQQVLGAFQPEQISHNTLPIFLNHLSIVSDQNIQKILQIVFSCKEPFPQQSLLFKEDETFTLLNGCLSKNTHFVDIIARPALRMIVNGDYKSFFNATKIYSSLQIYLLLGSYDLLKNNTNQLFVAIETISLDGVRETTSNLIQRFINDSKLSNFLTQTTGIRINSSALSIVSIPKILDQIILDLKAKDFDPFSRLYYFVIKDSDRSKDFSFFYACKAIVATIKMIAYDAKDSISHYLEMIADSDIKKSVVADIFSLIFLKKHGSSLYCCDVQRAQLILLSLTTFLPDSYFNSANDKLTFAVVKGGNSLTTSLVSPVGVVLDVMKTGEYDAALHVTKHQPKLMNIVRMIRAVNESRNKHTSMYDSSNEDDDLSDISVFAVEQFLTKPNSIFRGSYNESSIVVNEIAKRKKDKALLNITRKELINKLIKTTKFNAPSTADSQDFALFSSFLDYLDMYKSVRTYSNENLINSTDDILNDIIRIIIESGKIDSWKSMETLLGRNALEILLRYTTTDNIKMSIFDIICEYSTPTALAIFYEKLNSGKCDKLLLKQILFKIKSGRYHKSIEILNEKYNNDEIFDDDEDEDDFDTKRDVFSIFISRKLNQIHDDDSFEEIIDLKYSLKDFTAEEIDLIITNAFSRNRLDYNELDIIFFRFPDQFYKYICSNLSQFSPTILLKMVSFQGSACLFELRNKIDSTDPNIVIQFLIKKHLFPLLVSFVHEFQLQTVAAKIISDSFVSDITIEAFCNTCNDFLSEIQTRLSKGAKTALARVRLSITKRKQIELAKLKNAHPLNLELFETIRNKNVKFISKLNMISRDYSPHFAFNDAMTQWLFLESSSAVASLKTNTPDDEEIAIRFLRKLMRTTLKIQNALLLCGSSLQNETFLREIEIVMNILEQRPFMKFGYSYTFRGFPSRDCAMLLVKLCDDFDFQRISLDICSIWNINISTAQLSRATYCFNMGLLKQGMKIVQNVSLYKSNQDLSVPIDQMINTLMHPIPADLSDLVVQNRRNIKAYNSLPSSISIQELGKSASSSPSCRSKRTEFIRIVSMIESGQTAVPSIYLSAIQKIRQLSNSVHSTSTSAQLSILTKSLEYLSETWRLITLHSASGRFEDAIKYWNRAPDRQNMFVRCILSPALSYQNWNIIWGLISHDLKEFEPFVNEFFGFLRKTGTFLTLCDALQRLSLFDEAIDTALHWFKVGESFEERNGAISQLLFSIEKSISLREKGCEVNKQKFSHKQLVALRNRVNLQQRFNTFCQGNKIQFKQTLELLLDDKNAMSVILLMLRMGQFEYVMDTMVFMSFTFEEVCDDLLDSLQKMGEGAIPRFFSSVSKLNGEPIYDIIIVVLVERISLRVKDQKYLYTLIKTNVTSNQAKAKLFLKFGFLQDSFVIAKKYAKEIVRDILDQARIVGDTSLVTKCERFLR